MSGPYGSYYIRKETIKLFGSSIYTYTFQHLQGLLRQGVRKNDQIEEGLW